MIVRNEIGGVFGFAMRNSGRRRYLTREKEVNAV
jgi:hypothetical protein